jgi:branched-chain amino acid transport system substrate-binding protein
MKAIAERISCFFMITIVASALAAVSATAQDIVKIGAIYSLTGSAAGVATLQKKATELAVKEVNEAGGINLAGKKLKLEVLFGDDRSKPEDAAAFFRNFVKDQKAIAVVGSSFVPVVLALNSAAKKWPALYIATCLVPDNFHQQGVKAATALSIMGAASDIGRSGGSYLAGKMKPRKVACFVPSTAFANSIVAGFESVIKKYPEIEYQVFWYPAAAYNMKRDLEPVIDFRPDVIATATWGQDQVALSDEALKDGLAKEIKFFHFFTGNSSGPLVPPESLKGVRAQMIWHYDMADCPDQAVVSASNEFTSKFERTYNRLPDAYAMAAYSAVKEVARAIELSQSTNPVKMYEALMANPVWNGAKGEAKWRKDGRCMYKYFDWIVEGRGPDERKEGTFGTKYDYAKVVDVFTGEAFAPTLQELGY